MKRVIIIIVSVFIVVCAFTIVKNEWARLLPSPGFGMGEVIKAQHVNRLFIGSSMFRRGIDIKVLLEKEKNTYILGYNGNQPILMLSELQYLIDHGVTIDELYLDFYPYTAAARPKLSDTRLLLDTDTKFKTELWQLIHCDADLCDEGLQNNISSLFEMFVSSNNDLVVFWPIYWAMNRSKNRHGGSLQKLGGSTQDKLDNKPLFGIRDGLQAKQIDAYIHIIELAKERNIKLYFVETPKYYRIQEDADYNELRDDLRAAISKNDVKASWIFSDDVPFDHKDPALFMDLVHLSGKGAERYTRELASKMK